MRKVFLLLPAVIVLACHSVPGVAAPAGPSTPTRKGGAASVPAHVKELYQLDCATCHGATGDGVTPLANDMNLTLLDWTNPKSLAGFSDQQLFDVIRKGQGKMPPEDPGRAKNQDVWALVRYIRSMSKISPSSSGQ